MKSKPINFSIEGQHPRSQDLTPVKALNFAVTIWNSKKYIKHYEKKGHAIYTGNIGFYRFEGLSAIDIDWDEDFFLAQMIMENLHNYKDLKPKYDPVIDDLINKGESLSN